jgi:hypothetical protein
VKRGPKGKDIPAGTVVGFLTVLGDAEKPADEFYSGRRFLCECVCGVRVVRRGLGLRAGLQCHCGCKTLEARARAGRAGQAAWKKAMRGASGNALAAALGYPSRSS